MVLQGAGLLSSRAQIVTLTDQNSVALINTGTSAGMFNWTIDGVNNLNQQWFWYRAGAGGPEQAINTISAPTFSTPNARTLYVSYDNGVYGVTINYLLTGTSPGTRSSDISESISIINHSAAPLAFHFFQYSDFDLAGVKDGDVVQLGKNLRGLFNEADQSKPGSPGNNLTETVVTPGANHGEAALFHSTLDKLNDGNTDNLNDNVGPAGPGYATWALQWDFTIQPGSSVGISKDKYVHWEPIPEPSAIALISLGLIGRALRKRRQSAA